MALLCVMKSDHSELDLHVAQLHPDVGRTGDTAEEGSHCNSVI